LARGQACERDHLTPRRRVNRHHTGCVQAQS